MNQSPDTDIPGVYEQSSVPLSIAPGDVNAAHQAVLASLMQQYPVAPADNLMGTDPKTLVQMILNLLTRPPQAPDQQMPPLNGPPSPMPPAQMGAPMGAGQPAPGGMPMAMQQ